MAMIPHPGTGFLINEIQQRSGPVSEDERRVAQVLLSEGHPRWVVAAMLGRFPLAFSGTGRAPVDGRRRQGGNLSIGAAHRDPRQISMNDYADDFFSDLFGD